MNPIVERRLKKLEMAVSQMVNEDHLMDATVECDTDLIEFYCGQIRLTIRGYVWSEDQGRKEISYPKDWIEAFKSRWFPKWALKRWPVKMRVETVDMHVIFPDYRPPSPNMKFRMVTIPQPSFYREEDILAELRSE